LKEATLSLDRTYHGFHFALGLAPQHFAIKMGLYVSTNPQQLTE